MKQSRKIVMTKRFPYRVTVSWSAEDEIYIARIPKLEGILGLDERDPARAIRQAVTRGQEALAVLADHKHPLPEPDEDGKNFPANSMSVFSRQFVPLYGNGRKTRDSA
jgi:predicted RNase H-like HicB family nuclease